MAKVELEKYKELIEGNPISIATISTREREREREREPNIAIAADVVVVASDLLLVSHNEMVRTVKNIRENPAVCMTVFDSKWQGVRLRGRAEYVTEGKWYQRVRGVFSTEECSPQGAIVVRVDTLEEMS